MKQCGIVYEYFLANNYLHKSTMETQIRGVKYETLFLYSNVSTKNVKKTMRFNSHQTLYISKYPGKIKR